VRRVLTVSFGYPHDRAPARMLFTHEQARALARAGAHVEALDLDPPTDAPDLRDGIRVHRVPAPRGYRGAPLGALCTLRRARRRAREIVRAGRFDLVLLSFLDHKYGPLWDALGAAGSRRALTVHGVDAMARHEAPHVRWAKVALLRAADHAFAVSPATLELARDLVPPSARLDLALVENGVDRPKLDRALEVPREEHRRRLGWPLDQPVILSVGNLVARKGFDRLLDAAAELRARGRAFLWVMIGRGPEAAALTARADRLDLGGRVRFERSSLDDASLAGALAACDVFALASRTLTSPPAMEGFGVVYAEASYLGRPVVAGRSGGVPFVVADQETGLLVDPEGPDAGRRFADAVERILVDPALARRLGRRARERARARFDWDANAREVLARTAPAHFP
jgi:phosphatidylinositol alpha-1,6-mannosyltransferase